MPRPLQVPAGECERGLFARWPVVGLHDRPNRIYIVDVAAGQRLFSFEQDRNAPRVCLSPDGKMMACEGGGHFFRLGEIASGKDLQKLELPENYGNVKMAFAPDGRTNVGAEWDNGQIFLIDVRTGKELLRLQGANRC
jgi:WD40 repeat protein